MPKPLGFEKPLGMRDILPDLLSRQRYIENQLRHCIEKWGYQEIMTPTLEYYDTVGGASATLDDKLFKLLDRQGKTVVLRPDVTAPIARVVSSLLKEEPFPIRLYYHANVFRTQEKEAGRNAEFYQTGVELIGEQDVTADAEVIALAVQSLKEAGVEKFKIAVGHMGFLYGLFEEIVQDEDSREDLIRFLEEHNYVGYRERISELPLTDVDRRRLFVVSSLRGGAEKLQDALELTTNGRARKAVRNLQELIEALSAYDVMDFVIFDLNLVSNLDYYTGIVFEGYAEDLGFPVCSGGRYDSLLGKFGRPAPATGFALKMDRLTQASSLTPRQESKKRVLILFTRDNRAEAIREACRLRNEAPDMIVTTQLIGEIETKETPLSEDRFDQVIRLDGGGQS
ncbi:MAG: ATP phosphoribosyltransferase regulatory subunit [Bacillaceae bacterium]|nr:ATP phosphoribosyltransferase regulatory subunit [Bacillaceae bacterium]